MIAGDPFLQFTGLVACVRKIEIVSGLVRVTCTLTPELNVFKNPDTAMPPIQVVFSTDDYYEVQEIVQADNYFKCDGYLTSRWFIEKRRNSVTGEQYDFRDPIYEFYPSVESVVLTDSPKKTHGPKFALSPDGVLEI